MELYAPVQRWHVSETCLSRSIEEMSGDGALGNEGIVLWAGVVDDGIARITALIGLYGPFIQKSPLNIRIDPDLFNRVSIFCEENGLLLIGQVHSHPETFVDLSLTDKKYGIATPSFLSVVAPHYAQRSDTLWSDCGAHVFEQGHGFRRMSTAEATSRVVVEARLSAELTRLR